MLAHRLLRRLRALLRGDAVDEEMREEMLLHLELETRELTRLRGLAPEEARRQALVGFGGVDRFAEAHRDARGARWLQDLVGDARFALRSLRRNPAFTLSSVIVLALGIGSTTAVFTAVDAVLLAPLPYPDERQLVRIYEQNSPANLFGVSTVDYQAITTFQQSFASAGAVQLREVALSAGRDARRAVIGASSASFFGTLGVRAARGRLIEPSDEAPGAPNVAVVGYALAEHELGGVEHAIGRTVTLDGVAHSVVGVLPAGVRDLAGARAEVWPALQLPTPSRRGPFFLRVVARLNPGLALDAAARDLAGISERIYPQWASGFSDRTAKLTPYALRQTLLGDAGQTLRLFVAAVAVVLLIAIANVASLMLVRVTGRMREVALRTALGASRARLAGLLITESLVLATLGAVLGMTLAWGLLRALVVIGPPVPRLAEASIDLRAFAFAALLAVVTGVLVALHPVVSLYRRELAPALKSGERSIGAGRETHLLRGALVTAQFALALPLLATAGLLLNSFLRLQRVDPGFIPDRLLYVRVSLPNATYADVGSVQAFWTRALARVSELPGVEGVGINQSMPPDEPADINNFDLLDAPVPPGGAQPTAPWFSASPGFFTASGVPLLEGRMFTFADSDSAPPVLVVSRAWARHYSAGRPVVGRQLQGGGCTDCTPYTIVGVVGDVKYQSLGGNGEAVYTAPTQELVRYANLIVRVDRRPGDAIARVRESLRSLDPGLALDDAGKMSARIELSVAPQRHWTTLLGGFAISALALAAVGVFGMLSYLVTSRQREIGVRVALGADRRTVMAIVVRRGMTFAIVGALAGLAIALASGRWLAAVLFDVRATDPVTLATVTALLIGVALIACWIPARRAAMVAPMAAIREE